MKQQKKLHFMHIPKTGGTSLFTFLMRQFRASAICPSVFAYSLPPSCGPQDVCFNALSPEEIRGYDLFLYHLGWLPNQHFSRDVMDTITFIRHPIERMLSDFNHIQRDPLAHPHLSKRWKDFEDFLADEEFGDFYKANIQTRFFCADLYAVAPRSATQVAAQFFYLPFKWQQDISDKILLDTALERLHDCAFVGITEKYNASFNLLCEQYSWLPMQQNQKLNVAPNRTLATQLSNKTLTRAMELNQLDSILYQEANKILEDRLRTNVFFDRTNWEERVLRETPNTKEISFEFSEPFIGENWSVREGVAPLVFCWSQATTSTLLFAILQENTLHLRVHVLHILIPDSTDALRIKANDHPIALTCHPHPDGGWLFEGTIPAEAKSPESALLELKFELPEIKRPMDINPESPDARPLGFACRSVSISS